MNVFFDLIAGLMAFIYTLWNNYAWAITGLTLIVMVAVTPLTLKGTRSMMMMQQLQPEKKKLQTRYKDDRQKHNERAAEVLQGEQHQPAGRLPPLDGADAGLHRALRGAAGPDPAHEPDGLQLRLHRRPVGHGGPPDHPAHPDRSGQRAALRHLGGHGACFDPSATRAIDRPSTRTSATPT